MTTETHRSWLPGNPRPSTSMHLCVGGTLPSAFIACDGLIARDGQLANELPYKRFGAHT